MNYLDQYFEQERSRQPLVSEEGLRGLIREHGMPVAGEAGGTASIESGDATVWERLSNGLLPGNWSTTVWGLLLNAGLITGFVVMVTLHENGDHRAVQPEKSISTTIGNGQESPSEPGVIESNMLTADTAGGRGSRSVEVILPEGLPGRAEQRESDKQKLHAAIPAISYLDLTPQELAKLGIQSDSNGIAYFYRYNDKNDSAYYVASYDAFGRGDFVMDPGQPRRNRGVVQPVFHPRLVNSPQSSSSSTFPSPRELEEMRNLQTIMEERLRTDTMSNSEQAQLMLAHYNKVGRRSQELMNTGLLIPVRVVVDPVLMSKRVNRPGTKEVILWFEPSESFLDALPGNIAAQLRRELQIALLLHEKPEAESLDEFIAKQSAAIQTTYRALKEAGMLENGEGNEQRAGNTIISVLHSMSGAVTSSRIYPNPADKRVVVEYYLDRPRQVALDLYSLDGSYLRRVEELESRARGEHQRTLDLGTIRAGIYLLSILTDQGERALQRLIVE